MHLEGRIGEGKCVNDTCPGGTHPTNNNLRSVTTIQDETADHDIAASEDVSTRTDICQPRCGGRLIQIIDLHESYSAAPADNCGVIAGWQSGDHGRLDVVKRREVGSLDRVFLRIPPVVIADNELSRAAVKLQDGVR